MTAAISGLGGLGRCHDQSTGLTVIRIPVGALADGQGVRGEGARMARIVVPMDRPT